MNFVEIDNCPVPKELGRRVRKLKDKVPGATLTSCYRGSHPEGLRILRNNGKSSQAELYRRWQNREPGANPANPPGRSTHECRSDGVAYRGPLGRHLEGWQCGMDWRTDKVDALIRAGRGFTWALFRPYASGSEAHHLNFKIKPPWRWGKGRGHRDIPRTVKRGSRGRAVRRLQQSLQNLGWEIRVDGRFRERTEDVVKRFQKLHDLKPDGIVGPRTWREIFAAKRRRKR